MARCIPQWLGTIAIMAAASAAWADTQYSYIAQPSASNLSGGPVTVAIYLFESNVGAFSIAGDGGLAGTAFQVTRDGSFFAKITGVDNDPTNFSLYTAGNSTITDAKAVLATECTLLGSPAPVGGWLHLGSVTIAAGTGVGMSTFTVASAGTGNTVTWNATDLDTPGTGYVPATSSTFTISAVPEPTFLGLALTGSMLLLRRRTAQGGKRTMPN